MSELNEDKASDPYAPGGNRHHFWWANSTYIRAGLFYRYYRVIPVSIWILRPRYSWRTRKVF